LWSTYDHSWEFFGQPYDHFRTLDPREQGNLQGNFPKRATLGSCWCCQLSEILLVFEKIPCSFGTGEFSCTFCLEQGICREFENMRNPQTRSVAGAIRRWVAEPKFVSGALISKLGRGRVTVSRSTFASPPNLGIARR